MTGRFPGGGAGASAEVNGQLVIRQLARRDLPELEWEGAYRHFRRLYARAYRAARKGRAILWVAELEDAGLIGQVFVQLISGDRRLADGKNRAYLYSFRVRPEYRGQGVGGRLLAVAEADLVRRGCRKATLNVARDNPGARRFYERNGYRVVAPEPGRWRYVDHRGRVRTVEEPAWRMEKVL